MGAYVGGGSGSGNTHTDQIISKGKAQVKKIPAKVVKKSGVDRTSKRAHTNILRKRGKD